MGSVWLGKGFHAMRIIYFQNNTQNDDEQDPSWPASFTSIDPQDLKGKKYESSAEAEAAAAAAAAAQAAEDGSDPTYIVLKIDVGGAVGSKPLELKVATTNSISQVKDKLARQENIPAVQQDLLSGGASLSNDATVTSAGLQDGDTISLIRDPSIPTGTGSSGRKWSSQVLVVKYAGPDTGSDTHFELLKGYHERGAAGLGSLAGVTLADGSTSDFGDANKYREKNPFHDYDKKWLSKKLDKKWRVYDEADWKEEIGDHVTEIMKPWTDYTKKANAHHHGKVPDAIYSHHPDYNNEVSLSLHVSLSPSLPPSPSPLSPPFTLSFSLYVYHHHPAYISEVSLLPFMCVSLSLFLLHLSFPLLVPVSLRFALSLLPDTLPRSIPFRSTLSSSTIQQQHGNLKKNIQTLMQSSQISY